MDTAAAQPADAGTRGAGADDETAPAEASGADDLNRDMADASGNDVLVERAVSEAAVPEPSVPAVEAPDEVIAEGTVPEGTSFDVPESEPEPSLEPQPELEPEPVPEPEPVAEPEPEPEPEPELVSLPEPEGAPITRESLCDLVEGTWDTSISPPVCANPSRVFAPLPEPVGEPVTLVADEDDSFVSGSGRRIVRSEPVSIQVGTVLGRWEDGSIATIVTEIEDLGSGWWQVVVCTTSESFVLAAVGNVGWQFVAYAWREDDGRFRVEQDNWGPGNDGPC